MYQRKPKKKFFTFDIKPSGSTNKVKKQVIGLTKPKKETEILEEKKEETNEKITTTTIPKNYLIIGEVIVKATNLRKTETDLLVQNMQNQEQIQPQPDLFDIDDEAPKPQPESSDNKENKNQKSKKASKSYLTLPMDSLKLDKGEKENSKVKLMNMLKIKITRYLGFREGCLVIGEKTKNGLKVKSQTPLNRLFQVYIEKETPKKISFLFFNKQLNPCIPPKKKTFQMDKPQRFIQELKEELSKIDTELKIKDATIFQL